VNCSACGRSFPDDELIQFEGRSICVACKPVFVQELREGCLTPSAEALPDGFDARVLGMGELLAISWRLFQRDWRVILALALLSSVPINGLIAVFDLREVRSGMDLLRQVVVVGGLETVFGVFSTLGIAKVAGERCTGRRIGFDGASGHAFRHWWAGMKTAFLGKLITGLFFLFLIVPGLLWMGYYCFSLVIVSLRSCAGMTALDYSQSLVSGRWWTVVGRIIVVGIVGLVPIVPIHIAMAFAPQWKALSFGVDVLTDISYSFLTVGTAVLFLNLEAIRAQDPTFVVPGPRR
jgi:hypothetical protein